MSLPADIEELIADAPLSAHLATSVDDRPHVAPVWYVYDDGVLSILTGGKKLRNLRRNPRVAVSIEEADADGVEWGVQLLGTARVVEDDGRAGVIADRLNEKYYGGADGGELESDWALVEVEIASASSQRY